MNVRPPPDQQTQITIGQCNGLFGTRGWLKVYSYTRPKDRICGYSRWFVGTANQQQSYSVGSCKPHGNTIIALLDGIGDRDQAAELVGQSISILRSDLETTDIDEYYWADLIGMSVTTLSGETLGRITRIYETGANDVLEVSGDRIRLIPFVLGHHVVNVDLDRNVVQVDWHPDD